MNVDKIITNIRERGLEFKVEYKTDYPAVVDRILIKLNGEYVVWEDKHYLMTKKEWVQDFYSSCNSYCPSGHTDYGAERVLMKVVEELYYMRNKQ